MSSVLNSHDVWLTVFGNFMHILGHIITFVTCLLLLRIDICGRNIHQIHILPTLSSCGWGGEGETGYLK